MDKTYLEKIKAAEEEAAGLIGEARERARASEQEAAAEAEKILADQMKKSESRRENEFAEAQYKIKKIYDNKKTVLTVGLNDRRLKASGHLDEAAALIIERITEN